MSNVHHVPTLTVERRIRATPEELFDAWLDPDSLAVWMRPGGTTEVTVQSEPREGGQFEISMKGPFGSHLHCGNYILIDRPRALSFTWKSNATELAVTEVTVEFHAEDDGTKLILTHRKLPSISAVSAHRKGWDEIFDLLKSAMEAGTFSDIPAND